MELKLLVLEDPGVLCVLCVDLELAVKVNAHNFTSFNQSVREYTS